MKGTLLIVLTAFWPWPSIGRRSATTMPTMVWLASQAATTVRPSGSNATAIGTRSRR